MVTKKDNKIRLKSINKFFINIFVFFVQSKILFSIFLGNLLLFLLFSIEFEGVNIWTFIKLFIISIVFLKTNYLIKFFEVVFSPRKILKPFKNISLKRIYLNKKDFEYLFFEFRNLRKTRLIFHWIRSFIFTFIQLLFPITILWILFLLYLIIRYTGLESVSIEFISIITLFGIIISLFQFYLSDVTNRKNTSFNLISNEIKNELEENIVVGDFLELMKKHTPNLASWYEDTEDQYIDNPKKGGVRRRVTTLEKVYPNMYDFFKYIEENLKLLKSSTNLSRDRLTLIKELNTLYDKYLEDIEHNIYQNYKENKDLDEELLMEYLLDSMNVSNPEVLAHYFEESEDKKDISKIHSFSKRIQDIYLEVTMNVVISAIKKEKENKSK